MRWACQTLPPISSRLPLLLTLITTQTRPGSANRPPGSQGSYLSIIKAFIHVWEILAMFAGALSLWIILAMNQSSNPSGFSFSHIIYILIVEISCCEPIISDKSQNDADIKYSYMITLNFVTAFIQSKTKQNKELNVAFWNDIFKHVSPELGLMVITNYWKIHCMQS